MKDQRRAAGLLELVHAVVYFAPEPQRAYTALGLRGYWMGYFASRAAALGPAGPEEVTTLFGGFAPAKVARALPDAWQYASPDQVLGARGTAAAAVLRARLGDVEPGLLDLLERAVADLDTTGRPMAEAHRAAFAARPTADPVLRLWQAATVLREHRGDAHLQAVEEAGLRWPEPHLLLAATGRLDPRQQEHRGWDDTTWCMAAERVERWLRRRAAQDAYEQLEERTDELAGSPLEKKVLEIIDGLTPLAGALGDAVPFPNAMGLADPRRSGPASGPR